MSKLKKLDKPGIIAAAFHVSGDLNPTFLDACGGIIVSEQHKDFLASAITCHRLGRAINAAVEGTVQIGALSIHLQSIGEETWAAILPAGSPIGKSIRRLIRRAAKPPSLAGLGRRTAPAPAAEVK